MKVTIVNNNPISLIHIQGLQVFEINLLISIVLKNTILILDMLLKQTIKQISMISKKEETSHEMIKETILDVGKILM